ncbi:MAG: IclR family transcriptional regulator [Phycisphaerales bacterium]|nr:IclR family transcriptional regulator [Phycisphaerales bacterium]
MARAAKPATASSRRYPVPALEKGLDILELLSQHAGGLTQAEIAKTLGRSVGEIFRMLNCLVQRHYVAIRRPGDQYVLTLKMFELSHAHPPTRRLLTIALPVMHELAGKIHQSCHMTVVEQARGVILAQVDAPGEMGFAVRAGTTVNLLTTASGRVLLAFMPPDERQRLAPLLEATAAEHPHDAAEVEQVRQRGYEEMESTRIRGVHDFSFPVLDHRGHTVAALTVPHIERIGSDADRQRDFHHVRESLRFAAERLSAALGAGVARPHLTESRYLEISR